MTVDRMQPSIIGRDRCSERVKSLMFGSIKGLPKEAACPKASQKSVSSWDTLWLGLPAKKSVSHAKLNPQIAAGTRGFHRDAINPSKVAVSALLGVIKSVSLPRK
jgi:hypothetical protein